VLAPDLAGVLELDEAFVLDFPEDDDSPAEELDDAPDFSDLAELDDDSDDAAVEDDDVDDSDEEPACVGGIEEEPAFLASARESVR
jgi:hypothetical protein